MTSLSVYKQGRFGLGFCKEFRWYSILLLSALLIQTSKVHAQTYESKSCGACGKEVSINSHVGQRCPHCGVKWGSENTSTNYSDYYVPKPESGISNYGMTKTRCNVRSGPSKNYPVIDKLNSFQSVDIIDYRGSWYLIQYSDFSGFYNHGKGQGWVHSSLIY